MKRLPKTPQEWNAYRATLSCRIALNVFEGKRQPPNGTSPMEWGIYNLIHAVESLAKIHLPEDKP